MTAAKFIESKAFACAFIFLLSFCAYVFSLKSGFVWDDRVLIKEPFSRAIYLPDSKDRITLNLLIPRIRENSASRYYRPLVTASLVFDYRVWGINPLGFHLSNIVFNSMSTILFYLLALLVFGLLGVEDKMVAAFISSILFAVYPLHVEPVSWISGRADLLYSIFFFLAFIFHILSRRSLWFVILTAISFYLSLISKEFAVSFPLAVLGFDFISARLKNPSNILRYLVYLSILGLYIYVRGRGYVIIPELPGVEEPQSAGLISRLLPTEHIGGTVNVTDQISRLWEVSSTLLSAYLFYIKKLIFPFKLNALIAAVPNGVWDIITSVAVIFVMLIISFMSLRKRSGIIAFSLFWIIVTIGPPSLIAIFPVALVPLAERYLYLSSAGFCMLIGILITRSDNILKLRGMKWALVVILFTFYAYFTAIRQSVWKDDIALWRDTVKKSPSNVLAQSNYGVVLSRGGKVDEAIRVYSYLIENPSLQGDDLYKAHVATTLAKLYVQKGDYDNAEIWLHRATDYHSGPAGMYYEIGRIYFDIGKQRNSLSDYRLAEQYLIKALSMNKNNPDIHLLISQVYFFGLGDKEKAREHFKMAEQLIKSKLSR
jgi:hypothetical protein